MPAKMGHANGYLLDPEHAMERLLGRKSSKHIISPTYYKPEQQPEQQTKRKDSSMHVQDVFGRFMLPESLKRCPSDIHIPKSSSSTQAVLTPHPSSASSMRFSMWFRQPVYFTSRNTPSNVGPCFHEHLLGLVGSGSEVYSLPLQFRV